MDDKSVAFRRGAITGGAVVLALAWVPMLSGPATGNQGATQREGPHLVSVVPAPWRPTTEGDCAIIRAWSDGVLEVNFIATKPITSTTGQVLAPCSTLNPCLDDAWVQMTSTGVKPGRRIPAAEPRPQR
ncbi:MAG: hypothetical protein ACYS15_14570 [Planctomycetota bacterium]